jgi:hypothetical protein
MERKKANFSLPEFRINMVVKITHLKQMVLKKWSSVFQFVFFST